MGKEGSEYSASEESYWKTLLNQDPALLCRRSLATYDPEKGAYVLKVVNLNYAIAPRTHDIAVEEDSDTVSSKVGWDIRLLVLAYMAGATETPLAGRWVSPIGFAGGDLFFSSDAHNLKFDELLHAFKSPEDFLRGGQKIGGEAGKAGDSSFAIQALPRIPVLFVYWAGDEELPSKVSVYVDESARSHLPIDALWLAFRVCERRLLQLRPDNNPSILP